MSYDFVIVGAGHNGLAAGIILARAGWKVLVLESQQKPGGAIRTGEVTLPGFHHDLYATNLSAFAGSAFAQEFGGALARHGLEFVRAPKAFCSVFADGDWVGVTSSIDETAANIALRSNRDSGQWRQLYRRYQATAPHLFQILREPMPSWSGLRAALSCPSALPLIFESAGGFAVRQFEDPKMHAMWAVWGMHLDFSPDTAGGAIFSFLQCMQTQEKGLQIAKGGAQSMISALAALFRELGGELRCGVKVEEINVERGTAVSVVADGERIASRHGIIANLMPAALFSGLVKDAPAAAVNKARQYRHGPGTMMLHLALSDLPDWKSRPARDYFYVHIAPSLAEMQRTYGEACAGKLPHNPVLVVAQPTIVDPSRAPAGQHVLSVQVRAVPGGLDWKRVKSDYAEKMIDLLDGYAPGLRSRILAAHLISPADLERDNPNLAGGDSIGGSHHLSQNFVNRPFLGWSRYRTPVRKLYLCGAATWPGAGSGAGSGWILGHMLAGNR